MLFNGSYSNDSDGAIIKFFWTFSDGFATTTQVSTVEHTFNQPGVFTAKLIVQDNQLAKSAAMSVSFTVEEGLAAKLLITEIQIRDASSSANDFIELFNPTASDIDISDFQIKKKSSSGAEYSIRVLPDNSIIKAQGYFLWANTGYAPGGVIPDIISSQTISADNSVALLGLSKNIIDQVAWGAGVNQFVETAAFPDNPPENSTTTITRRKNGAGDFQDTNNNSADFILSDPSPTNSAGDTGNYLPPTLPADFTITTINQDNKNAASLSWTASSDPDTNPEKISYEILCSIQPLDNYFTTGTTTDLLFQATTSKQTAITMPDLFENLVFYFAIRSFDGLYYSPYAATTYLSPPALVSEFIAASSANRGTVDLFWTNTGAPQYIINYNNQSLTVNNDYSSSVITTTVSGLAGGQAVNFTIRSLNTAGTASATSTIAAATPLNSFQDNSDGTITDLYSGLMWVKDGSGFGAYNGAALT